MRMRRSERSIGEGKMNAWNAKRGTRSSDAKSGGDGDMLGLGGESCTVVAAPGQSCESCLYLDLGWASASRS